MKNYAFLVFVALAFISWGVYGPVLHEGQHRLGIVGQPSTLRPLICVGIAYFVIAVLVPLYVLYSRGESGKWTFAGFFWSFVAGALGALGALGIVLAFKFGGLPVYVMPLVFGCAPVVNTLVTMAMGRSLSEASQSFYVGVVVVAIGAAGVMFFKPSKSVAAHPPAAVQQTTDELPQTKEPKADSQGDASDQSSDSASGTSENAPPDEAVGETSAEQRASAEQSASADSNTPATATANNARPLLVVLSVALTALCWGGYGPVLHRGQAAMGNSRLRPFLCVGLAYFVLAVVLPLMLLPRFPEAGELNVSGVVWSLMGGTAGAIGALGIIYAFNYGGKPLFVMPLVFGGAPVVNTFTEIVSKQLYGQVSTYFYISLALVIVGAVTVLVCAPRHKPKAVEAKGSLQGP